MISGKSGRRNMGGRAENLKKPAIPHNALSRLRLHQDSLIRIGLQPIPGAEHGVGIAVTINLG
jgi:hypothetical protein